MKNAEEKISPETSMPTKSQEGKMWVAIVVIIALIGIYFLTKGRTADSPAVTQENPVPSQTNVSEKNEKIFNLTAAPFAFSQKEIRVKKGDRVKINLTVTQGLHDWVIDDFKAQTKQLKSGESDSIVFVADQTGIFEYYCSVANHRQMGMVGQLIVE